MKPVVVHYYVHRHAVLYLYACEKETSKEKWREERERKTERQRHGGKIIYQQKEWPEVYIALASHFTKCL